MINSLSRYLAIPAIILLASCKGDGKKDVVMTANQSGNITRAHWQAERKPIVIETDTLLTECIGVSMLLRDATEDEFKYPLSPKNGTADISGWRGRVMNIV